MSNYYPKETVEYVTVNVTIDGVKTTAGVQLSVVPNGERPGAWADAVVVDGDVAYLIDGMDVGVYAIWGRVDTGVEMPVIECGTFRID